MGRFKVGDRVRYNGRHSLSFDKDMLGKTGTVTKDDGGIVVGVEWDGLLVRNYGVYRDNIELAPLFAVGDKVRVDWPADMWRGDAVVEKIDDYCIVVKYANGRCGGFDASNLTLLPPTYTSCAAAEVDNLADEYGGRKAKFKVGDRVKTDGGFTFDPGYGTITKTHINGDANAFHVDVDGQDDDDWFYYATELEHVAAEPATTITIRAGRFYQTRDGRKVGPMAWRNAGTKEFPWEGDIPGGCHKGCKTGFIFRLDGTNYEHTNLDLIAEWPAVAPQQHTTIASIGDIVRKHSGTSIVCLIENGQPKPATEPFVHADASAACTEATRLAGIHKGQEFGVYECVDVKKVERVYDHEWQRLAACGQKINAIRELRSVAGLGLATSKSAVEDWLSREQSMRAA